MTMATMTTTIAKILGPKAQAFDVEVTVVDEVEDVVEEDVVEEDVVEEDVVEVMSSWIFSASALEVVLEVVLGAVLGAVLEVVGLAALIMACIFSASCFAIFSSIFFSILSPFALSISLTFCAWSTTSISKPSGFGPGKHAWLTFPPLLFAVAKSQ